MRRCVTRQVIICPCSVRAPTSHWPLNSAQTARRSRGGLTPMACCPGWPFRAKAHRRGMRFSASDSALLALRAEDEDEDDALVEESRGGGQRGCKAQPATAALSTALRPLEQQQPPGAGADFYRPLSTSFSTLRLKNGSKMPAGQQAQHEQQHEQQAQQQQPWGVKQRLSIVLLVIGTRGDVQPFLAVARRLMADGHRVRLASHGAYRDWVASIAPGVEFAPLPGDPKTLSQYAVVNGGIVPTSVAQWRGHVDTLRDLIFATWPACSQPCGTAGITRPGGISDLGGPSGPGTASSAATTANGASSSRGDSTGPPSASSAPQSDAAATSSSAHDHQQVASWRPDLILATPAAFGQLECADALGVPLQLMYMMPWSPTRVSY